MNSPHLNILIGIVAGAIVTYFTVQREYLIKDLSERLER